MRLDENQGRLFCCKLRGAYGVSGGGCEIKSKKTPPVKRRVSSRSTYVINERRKVGKRRFYFQRRVAVHEFRFYVAVLTEAFNFTSDGLYFATPSSSSVRAGKKMKGAPTQSVT